MDPVNLLGVLLGVGALALIVLAIFRGEFREIETPKYEMLGREPPQEARPARPGRLGSKIALFAWGWQSPGDITPHDLGGEHLGALCLLCWRSIRGDGAACS
jgi:hypothetical protein